jgi:hypothetical protein
MRSRILMGICLLVAFSPSVSAQTLEVRHDHDPWGGCEGELTITAEGIRYETDKEEHSRSWNWVDIQGFDRKSATEFSVLTYEDLTWHAGLDRNFDFTTLPGTIGLDETAFTTIATAVARPVTDRVIRAIDAEYQVRVKHLHVFGGCEGTLRFGPDWIVYDTDHAEDARSWRRDTHIANVWSSNEFELELRILEENQRAFDKATRFTFQLKEPLDKDYYERLRREYLLAR